MRSPGHSSTPSSRGGVVQPRQHVLGVVVHPHHPLALQRQQAGRAHRVHAHERVRSRGRSAKWRRRERLHALHERLLRAGRQQDHPHARDRLVAQRARQAEQHGYAAEVVVGARHHLARADVGHGRRVARAQDHPGAAQPRRSRTGPPAATSAGPATAPHIVGGVVFAFSTRPGSASAAPAAGRRRTPGPCGRRRGGRARPPLRGVGIADPGHHVRGHAPAQEAAPKPLPAAGDVVGHGGGGERAGQHRLPAPAASGPPARPWRRAARPATSTCRARARARRPPRRPPRAARPRSARRHGPRPTTPSRARWPPGVRRAPATGSGRAGPRRVVG